MTTQEELMSETLKTLGASSEDGVVLAVAFGGGENTRVIQNCSIIGRIIIVVHILSDVLEELDEDSIHAQWVREAITALRVRRVSEKEIGHG